MKIGNNPTPRTLVPTARAARQQPTAPPPPPAPEAAAQGASRTAAGVPVTLSATVRGADASRSSADFDAGKVKAVKAAIENGTFKVNAEAVADKLLANAEETLSRSRG